MSSNKTQCPHCGKHVAVRGLSLHLQRNDDCARAISHSQYRHEPPVAEVIAGSNPSNTSHDQTQQGYRVDQANLPLDHPAWDNNVYQSLNEAEKADFCRLFETHLYQIQPNNKEQADGTGVQPSDDMVQFAHASDNFKWGYKLDESSESAVIGIDDYISPNSEVQQIRKR